MASFVVLRSKSAFLASQGTLLVVLLLLKQMRADLKSANEVFALTQEIVLAYCSLFFSPISSKATVEPQAFLAHSAGCSEY